LITSAWEIAAFLGLDVAFPDFEINGPSSLSNPKSFSVAFANQNMTYVDFNSELSDILILARQDFSSNIEIPVLIVDNPRLRFAQVVWKYFSVTEPSGISRTAICSDAAMISKSATIGEFTIIENGVTIGDHVVIGHHTVIHANTMIGNGARIGSNTVIGTLGLGFERDENNILLRLPHVGNVIIDEDVEIGSCVTIARGTIDSTHIGSMVKIDDHVFIAHNVNIGARSILVAGCEVSGSVQLGEDCWIGPQSTIRDGLIIGSYSTVGMGSVVTKNVDPRTVVAGNPARVLKQKKVIND